MAEGRGALLLVFLVSVAATATFAAGKKRAYIVYMNAAHKPAVQATHEEWYQAHLQSLSIDPARHLLYAYSAAARGFAALLHPDHVDLLRRHPSVLNLHPDTRLTLHTTRSPQFLGLTPWPAGIRRSFDSTATTDVIIGVLDTGVWPESPSFDDAGLPAVPSRWRGACEPGVDFSPSLCNRKLVGARSFNRGFHAAEDEGREVRVSARDTDGHGTHTASTAAGAAVANASLLGYASGVARGMAPGARIAAYKVCWSNGCYGSDILAGIDQAIADGVDILSLSLGGSSAPFSRDPVAVGAFSAVQHGIFVSCSAGNSGPARSSLTNTAPWVATIGAGTLDRDFPAYVQLSNGERFAGLSLSSEEEGIVNQTLAVVYGMGVQSGSNSSKFCMPGTLDPNAVRGKVVLCDRGINARVEKGQVVKDAGGAGMILANGAANGEELVADSHLLPTVAVGAKNGDLIREHISSSSNPTVTLSFRGTVLGVQPSPVVAAFSSRGPNMVVPELLKPDLIGPGVNILAGWTGSTGPTGLAKDNRRSPFNIMSGTSMSCPHISGVAALLKAAHPDWSPSAIKSALMTTAYTEDNTGAPLVDAAGGSAATPWSYGSGHVDPQKALSPGLIYDIKTDDYVAFLCSLDYPAGHIQAISQSPNTNCSRRLSNPGNLNYPSFSVVFGRKSRRIVKFNRELTNVGVPSSVYFVNVSGPPTVKVSVKPTKLVFSRIGQKLSYKVSFASSTTKAGEAREVAFGWISWMNKEHRVRSPVSFRWWQW
ncbi:subtilisin-like protease SBT1.8 [Zingiber officinale]|uniref:subtilisin-like protease SBT1.8 n=1 Tax=Zingiber officinale TaxID=94328 RepID=UPI001C4C37D7|nr:subtilisin-like protease SBT1.8 [Zingiber officinale]